ncbi:MAG: aldo/keto reductase [Nitrospira sp.]|nr:aldo/keto reductase [Nitrospira sp.]MCA9499794.1 aldo/keto reductase [Nitrospira sp.]
MNYRQLGGTGIEVSDIGFGAWGIGGDAYGTVDDQNSLDAIAQALDSGINFFDTADLYGGGHSEELLGVGLKGRRNRAVIATKVGTLPHSGFYMPQDFSPEYIRKGLEGSLKRLQTDYLDLYQLHSPKIDQVEPALETLQCLRQEGKIREFGVSARSPQDALTLVQYFNIPVLQVNFNLIDQRVIDCGLSAWVLEHHIGVVVRTPLCFGFLTGELNGNEQFSGTDHRNNWPTEQRRRWANAPTLFAHLLGEKVSPVHLALGFCLSFPFVSTVIPGMLTREQVEDNVKALEQTPLEPEELKEIRKIYEEHEFYDPGIKQALLQHAG